MPPNLEHLREKCAGHSELLATPVLVVDDIEDNRDLLSELLSEAGYEQILLAASGPQALELLEKHPGVGLVLLDLMMPVMDGYETCRRINQNPLTAPIPVIVVTGGALRRDEALLKSFECGAMDYIAKPVNEVELFGRVKSALLLFQERMRTRRKTQELLESQERYDLAVNGANDGIWDLNLQTNQAYFSPTWIEMLGYEINDLPPLKSAWDDLVHPEDRDRVLAALQEHWQHQTPFYSSEHRLRTKSGDYKYVFVRGRAIWNESGQVIRMAGSTTDITARKHLETQLRQAQQMESIGRLAAGVAHDFNNLLTAILGHVNLGKRSLPEDSPVQLNFEKIQRASLQAADFCKQLLAYSGQGRYTVQRLDLNQLVRETAELIHVSISRKISVQLQLSPQPVPIEADPSQIRQIVLNLLINAAEAIGEQAGVIRLRTSAVHATAEEMRDAILPQNHPGCDYAQLEISDTGCGITPENLKKIFDPFFTTKFTGRGLGLSAVLGIVRANEGALKVHSQVGEGTSFKLLLPRAAEPAPVIAPSPAVENGHWHGSGTVLVVEDEPIIREVAEALLQDLGFDVLLAEDGLQGVDTFKVHQDKITAVILDLNMPNLNGEEAYKIIREIRPEVPILLASGYSEQETVRRFTDQGPARFLQKPFLAPELEARLRACLCPADTNTAPALA